MAATTASATPRRIAPQTSRQTIQPGIHLGDVAARLVHSANRPHARSSGSGLHRRRPPAE